MELEKRNFDLEILTPLTGHLENSDNSSRKKIGIAMAFDINEEITNDQSKHQLELTLNQLSGVIVDCRYIKDALRETYFYKGEIWQVPYGCDFFDFHDTAASIGPEINLVINRKWGENYGNEIVLEAISLMQERIKIKAKFIGGGTELNRLRQKYRDLEVLGTIDYLPSLSKKQMILEFHNNWIYVSASKSDGTSISLLEAMSAGMICVTSDFASNKEWIESGVNGYTFANNSAESLAETLLTVSKMTPKMYSEMRKIAITKARDKGDWRQNKVLFQEAIRNCLVSSA
jgi:glycosyltransferase involved in cell wall biosynthesis